MTHRSRVIFQFVVLTAVLALPALVVWKVAQFVLAGPDSPRPAPRLFASSDSLDGKYRCEIWEQTPAWGMSSPYTYRLTILDLQTLQPLPGESDSAYGDSCAMCPDPKFDWADDHLMIKEENGNCYF